MVLDSFSLLSGSFKAFFEIQCKLTMRISEDGNASEQCM